MATPALCYYCFECLSASFKRQEPPSLAAVEELWEQHEQAKEAAVLKEKVLVSQVRTSDLSGSNVDGLYNSVDVEEESDVDNDDDDGESLPGDKNNRLRTIKLPGIKRLQRGLQSDSSSSTSTPSTLSAHSSRSALSNSTTVTTPLSQPSSYSMIGTPSSRRPKRLEDSYPLFVTWNTLSKNGHKSLRGCIGTFEAHELGYGLKTYALTSYVSYPFSVYAGISVTVSYLSYKKGLQHADIALTGPSMTADSPRFQLLYCRLSPVP